MNSFRLGFNVQIQTRFVSPECFFLNQRQAPENLPLNYLDKRPSLGRLLAANISTVVRRRVIPTIATTITTMTSPSVGRRIVSTASAVAVAFIMRGVVAA